MSTLDGHIESAWSPKQRRNFIERSLFLNGFVYLEGGLSIVEENGKRRFFQICPSCSSTTGTDDTGVAEFIRKYNCLSCRWRETERGVRA